MLLEDKKSELSPRLSLADFLVLRPAATVLDMRDEDEYVWPRLAWPGGCAFEPTPTLTDESERAKKSVFACIGDATQFLARSRP